MASLPGLTGLTGLTPTVTPLVFDQPGVTLDPSVMGGPYNPAHGDAQWEMGEGYPVPWAIQQHVDLSGQAPTVEGSLIETRPADADAGYDPQGYADPTFTLSHNAPWPYAHIPNSGAVDNAQVTAVQSQENMQLHSIDSGDPAAFTQWPPPASHKMPWELNPEYVSSGVAEGTGVGQLTGNNRTGWDRFAGWTVPGDNINRFGMDSAHVTRFAPAAAARVPVPLDTMQGAQRPMVMNIPGRYGSYPVGQGSPFTGQLPGVGNDTGAAEIGVASDYTPPPDAPTNGPLQVPAGQPVWGVTGLGF
jgi:hypothetical protein